MSYLIVMVWNQIYNTSEVCLYSFCHVLDVQNFCIQNLPGFNFSQQGKKRKKSMGCAIAFQNQLPVCLTSQLNMSSSLMLNSALCEKFRIVQQLWLQNSFNQLQSGFRWSEFPMRRMFFVFCFFPLFRFLICFDNTSASPPPFFLAHLPSSFECVNPSLRISHKELATQCLITKLAELECNYCSSTALAR